MTKTTTTNPLIIGLDVDVYFNLHKKCWSVRDRKSRLVIAHAAQVVLSDVTFRVSAAGNARVRREGKKNVHAFARGTVVSIGTLFTIEGSVGVTYNPYKYTTFVNADNERPVYGARLAGFSGRSVQALDTVSTCGKVAA